ncbi:MAG: hypothetical protein C0486_01450 [Erythrobacter sp.]|nr:hypothetical protein [Erythrobacter sp.]MBA4080310.1 hypothetical protein [Erythrobacter sp.]
MSANIVTLVPGLAPAAPLMRLLARFDRAKIEAFAEISIALLDLADGDPDAETEGLEDDFSPLHAGVDYGPGCPLADPAEEDDPQGACDEDEVSTALASTTIWMGPGCPISDPAEGREDWLP